MQIHRLGVAGRQDQGCALALLWADRAEDVGGSGALVAGCAWAVPRFAQRRVILFFWPIRASSANQISYLIAVDRLLARDGIQARVGRDR
jgi:hypothetical protein